MNNQIYQKRSDMICLPMNYYFGNKIPITFKFWCFTIFLYIRRSISSKLATTTSGFLKPLTSTFYDSTCTSQHGDFDALCEPVYIAKTWCLSLWRIECCFDLPTKGPDYPNTAGS